MSFVTGSACELLYASTAATAAKASWTTEFCINPGSSLMGVQARLEPDFWLPNNNQITRAIRITARGVLSTNTVAPSYTWRVRAGGAGAITGPILLATAAQAGTASMTNVMWGFEGDVIVSVMGAAGGNSTVAGFGEMSTGQAIGTGQAHKLTGTAATLDTSITNYINVTVTSSANAVANSITLLQLLVWGLN